MKKTYSDHRQSSGITHFAVYDTGITIHFGTKAYRYTHESAGREHVAAMKRLAEAGLGLGTYIRANSPEHVKDKEQSSADQS